MSIGDLGPFDQRLKAMANKKHLLAIARGAFLPPVSVKIELTNVCNQSCHFCAYAAIVDDPSVKDMLDEARALDLVDELAEGGVRGLMFTGGGEPLLHPGVERIFERCRDRAMQHAVITNGTRVHKLADETLRGLRWIRFSINAGSAAEYARVHRTSERDWEKVWSAVARVSDRARFPDVAVGVSFVVTAETSATSMRGCVLMARERGAAYVHLRPAFEGPHTRLGGQMGASARRARVQELATFGELETATFRVYGITRRFDEIDAPDRAFVHCGSTPLVSYVLPNGDVSICTMIRDRFFNPAVANPFLGNLNGARFFDLWGTARHAELIAALSSSNCGRCHFSEYNRVLAAVRADACHEAFL